MVVGDSIGFVAGWIRKSVSEVTWSAYSKVWHEWQALVQEVGDESVDGAVGLLVYYVVRMMEEGVPASALHKQLAGLAFLFKLQGQPDFTKDFWVRQAMKGYRQSVVRTDSRRR